MDDPAAAEALHEAQARALKGVATRDWARRDIDAMSPPTFPRL